MAGTDTTSTSITYLFWELGRRPDIMKKLQAELDEAMSDSKVIPNISVLQQLPYLCKRFHERVYDMLMNSVTHIVLKFELGFLRL